MSFGEMVAAFADGRTVVSMTDDVPMWAAGQANSMLLLAVLALVTAGWFMGVLALVGRAVDRVVALDLSASRRTTHLCIVVAGGVLATYPVLFGCVVLACKLGLAR